MSDIRTFFTTTKKQKVELSVDTPQLEQKKSYSLQNAEEVEADITGLSLNQLAFKDRQDSNAIRQWFFMIPSTCGHDPSCF